MFRRSELFEKSLIVILLLFVFAILVLSQLQLAGRMLPVLLQEYFPQRAPAEWVYGLLIPIFAFDFSIRYFFQSLPAQHVRPYLHLPIQSRTLVLYRMMRSWLHPVNLYLPVFFYSFIKMTINPATSSQGSGLLGIVLLVAINQGALMWIKSFQGNKMKTLLPVIIILGGTAIAWSLYTDALMQHSLDMFLGFVNNNLQVFVPVAAIIVLLHLLAFHQMKKGFYQVFENQSPREAIARGRFPEGLLASVPKYGQLWLLEWQLASRSKRSRFNFFGMIPMAIAFSLFIVLGQNTQPETYIVIILMIAGSYGGFHLQNAFSWESHFFDFLATRDIPLKTFIKAKFYFYSIYAAIQLIVLLPFVLWHSLELAMLFVGLFFYATGFGFFFYLWTGVGNSTRLDANGRSSFNMEGVTGIKMAQVMVLFLSVLPFLLIGYILPLPHGSALLFSLTGLIFILTHNSWINGIVRKFEKRKYVKLNLYRQK